MTHPIVQKFLAGNPVAGGTIHALELEIERLQKRIAELEAAQQGVQSDVACACGHQWLSHNDNGCCWDDECQCTRPAANANSV